MSVFLPNLKHTVAAFVAIVMFSLPSGAENPTIGPDLTDPDALLAQLAEADPAEAMRIDRQLKAIWSKSGSAAMDLLLKRGRDALEVDNLAAAIEHLTALTDHAPDFAEGFHARASAYYEAELYGPALSDLERALALNPNNYDAIFGLGTILEVFNEDERAFEMYSRSLELHPHNEPVTDALERLKPKVAGKTL